MQEFYSFWNLPFTFLFESWKVNGPLALIFTCLGIGCIALLFEGIRVFRVWVKRKWHVPPLFPLMSKDFTISGSCSTSVQIVGNESYVRSNRIKNHISQTLLHILRLVLSYLLMLAVMSYNAYVSICIVIGSCLGYFIFCHELTRWREPGTYSCEATSVGTVRSSASSTPHVEEERPMIEVKLSTSNTQAWKRQNVKLTGIRHMTVVQSKRFLITALLLLLSFFALWTHCFWSPHCESIEKHCWKCLNGCFVYCPYIDDWVINRCFGGMCIRSTVNAFGMVAILVACCSQNPIWTQDMVGRHGWTSFSMTKTIYNFVFRALTLPEQRRL